MRRMFQDAPGVLRSVSTSKRKKNRSYETLRIPESVAERVYREHLQNVERKLDHEVGAYGWLCSSAS